MELYFYKVITFVNFYKIIKGIKSNSSHIKTALGPDEFYPFMEEIPISQAFSKKTQRILLNSFYEVNLILILKPDTKITENYEV
jgi:hypothetical protein